MRVMFYLTEKNPFQYAQNQRPTFSVVSTKARIHRTKNQRVEMGWLLLPLSFIIHQVAQAVKNPSANVEDARDTSSITGSVRSPGIRNGNPSQYSCLENFMDRRAWQSMGLERLRHNWSCACTRARAHTHTHTQCLLNYLSTPNPSCQSTNRQRECYTKVNIWLPRGNYISTTHQW